MSFELQPQNTTVVGMTGSGKTTFVLRLLLNRERVACRFVFDDENRTAPRLRLKPCYTLAELNAALGTRWVVFNPSRMFYPQSGDRDILAPKKRAFAFFCSWIFEVSKGGPGEKMISLPEIWRFCTPDSIPPEFATIMQMGRELGLHVITDTQRPELVNESIIGATTELVSFKLVSPAALNTVKKIGADAAQIAGLPLGHYVSRNILSGSVLRGKVF
jgi:hypothetical protein